MIILNNIAIFPNTDKDPGLGFTKEVVKEILKYGKTVFLSASLSEFGKIEGAEYLFDKELFDKADLIVCLGGDGTVLNTAKNAAIYSIPVMGINIGNLGFLTQAERGDLSVFADIFSGNYTINESMLLEVSVLKNGSESESYLAFNDAVIRGSYSKMVTLNISVDGTVMNEYVADGAVFSTAAGSTAYSMSAGGPIVHPSLKCMIISPICPHTLSARSVVIPPESTISAKAVPPYRCDAVLTVDGKKVHTLLPDEYVTVKQSEKRTMLLNVPERNFFDVVREKLSLR